MTPPRDDPPIPDYEPEAEVPDLPDVAKTLPKLGNYYCAKCGSNRLSGLQPTVDTKNRWAIASKCRDCKRTRVIAIRY